MSEQTKIEWADSTFNPWIGCTRVSPACDDCYAARSTPARALGVKWGAGEPRQRTSAANWKLPLQWERKHAEFFATHGRRQRVFCASLADVFDNEVPPEWRAELFALIAETPHLDWLLLTKRIGDVGKMIEAPGMQKSGLPANVWLGATVVNQAEADRDIPKLLGTPAAVRFLSIEPMLGPVDFAGIAARPLWPIDEKRIPRIDWVIAGGESGPKARPSHPDWYRGVRDQCAAAGVPFLFKQWGEWARGADLPDHIAGSTYCCFDGDLTHDDERVWKVGKKAAGRLLDGVEHNGFPS